MAFGLSTTLELLTGTDNEAASQVLIAALDAINPAVQEAALVALLKRRTAAGGREIIDRLSRMKPEWKTAIRQHRGRLTGISATPSWALTPSTMPAAAARQ